MPKQTYGEYLVGLSFNPSGSPEVEMVKQTTADMIDELYELSQARDQPGAREASIAITNFEQAAMWAVKAFTKQPRDLSESDPEGEALQRHADQTGDDPGAEAMPQE